MTPPETGQKVLGGTDPLRILLVDDHALFRAGIRGLLERHWPGAIVLEADGVREATEICRQWPVQLALVDISLKESNGIQLVRQLRELAPPWSPPPCMMLSMHTGEGYVRQALEAGASGYVIKDAEPRQLLDAAATVLAGGTYVSPLLGAGLVKGGGKGDAPSVLLSPRQIEVLVMVANGQSTKFIARKLGVSVRTVDAHRREIGHRLNLHDVASWVRYAERHGLNMEKAT